jgi:heme iron utilization protein
MNDSSKYQVILYPLFKTQKFAVLSTFSNGQPYSNLVAFASSENLKLIVFVTNKKTRKYDNIRKNSRVAILIDNRKNKSSDLSNAFAVTAIGVAEELNGANRNILSKIYVTKHPSLSGFLNKPESVLMRIEIGEYIIAGFDKSQRFIIRD